MTSPRGIFSTPIVAFPSIGIKTYIECDFHIKCMRIILEDKLSNTKDLKEWLAIRKDLTHLIQLENGLHDMEDYV